MPETRHFIGLQGGRRFYLDGIDTDPSEVSLKDIAHALVRINRYNQHGAHFWSVATHSLHVAWILHRFGYHDLIFEGLAHDFEEAYVGDLTAPMKRALYPHYHNFLAPIRAKVRRAIGLANELPEIVRQIDQLSSYVEVCHLFGQDVWEGWGNPPVGFPRFVDEHTFNDVTTMPAIISNFAKLDFASAEAEFLSVITERLY